MYKVRMSNGSVMIVKANTLVDAARKAEQLSESQGYYAEAMEINPMQEVGKMKGYVISEGYMGYIAGVGYILFATETDYKECYKALEEAN